MERVATEKWDATWTIFPTNHDHVVNIEMDVTISGYNVLAKCAGGVGYYPRLPPISLKGTISATSLSVTQRGKPWGEYSFTTDRIQGTHDHTLCDVLSCQRTYSGANDFKLSRQQ